MAVIHRAPAAAADRPANPTPSAGAVRRGRAYVGSMLRDVVAVLVIVLLFADIARMVFAEN
ncbi:MAG TPA: hypothetical protein VKO84_10725 [Gaiellaceae bacterium]|nr:hypothetical protein [Gaiellaceae bacterium]